MHNVALLVALEWLPVVVYIVIFIDKIWQGKNTAKVIQDTHLGMQELLLLKD